MPYPNPNEMKAPLARARGHGSAKSGTHHWWSIKWTAIALIPLTLWFFFSLICVIAKGGTYGTALEWIQKPYNSLLLIIFLGVNFHHAAQAGQEIIVDYVSNHKIQLPTIMFYKFFCYGLAMLSVFSVLYITLRIQ